MRTLIVLSLLGMGSWISLNSLAVSEDNNPLFHKQWVLKKIQGIEVPEGSSLIFEPNKITGSTGCNKFWAPVEYKALSEIDIGPPQSARVYCFRAMALERAYLAALESIRSFNLKGSTLTLMMEDGDVYLEFENKIQSK